MRVIETIADEPIGDIVQGSRYKAENPFSPTGMGIEAPLTPGS